MTWLLSAALAAAPMVDAPGDARPQRHWDLEHVDLSVRIDPEARRIDGEVVHHLRPIGLPTSSLTLHQVALDITGVEVDGVATDWVVGPSTLHVPLDGTTPHEVRITWHATPATGVHFRAPEHGSRGVTEVWTQGENEDHRHWFPSWDHPSDRFTLSTALTVPSDLHAVANGVFEGADDHGSETTWRYHLAQPIVNYLVAFAVGQHTVVSLDGPVPMEAIVPAGVPEDAVRDTLRDTGEMLGYFAELTGHPYPYPVYRQVFVQRFLYLGMENASTTIMDEGLLFTHADDPRVFVERVFAHEAAHQWFGDLLTCHGWRELWLNEGFARFMDLRWVEHRYGAAAYAQELRRLQPRARDTRQAMSVRGWSDDDPARPYTSVYARGATTLHMLRTWLGDATFDRAIRTYVARHAGQLVETADLRRVFEEETAQHLGWFFDAWAHGHGAPTIRTRYGWEEGELTVDLHQEDAPWGPWRGPLELAWQAEDGTVSRRTLQLGAGHTKVLQPVEDGVQWVSVDPRGGLLATWEHSQSPSAWAAQALQAPDPWARLVAIEQLGEVEAEQVALDALGTLIEAEDESDRPYVVHALGALGVRGTDGARDLLLGLEPGSVEVRRALADALETFPLDGPVESRLRTLVKDPVPAIQGAAVRSLRQVRPSTALALARRRMPPHHDAHPVVDHLHTLEEHGDAGDLRLVEAWMQDGRRSVQHAAGHAAVALVGEHELVGRMRRRVARALERWLGHGDLLTRRTGAFLLGRLGDPASTGPLRAYASTTTLSSHRDVARGALTAIQARQGAPEDPDALLEALAALDVLQEQLSAVEQRLGELEARP